MRRFEMQRSKAYQRLGLLVDAGLARHEPGIRSRRIYLATTKGLAATELDLPRATVSAASFAHDSAVVDVAIPLERSTSLFVVTEREIRRADARGDERFRLTVLGSRAERRRGAWPDLVLIDRARQTMSAVEVELSLKQANRLSDKLLAYGGSRYERVQYVCGTRAIAAAVVREARRAGVERMIEITTVRDAVVADARSTKADERDDLLALLQQVRAQAADANSRADAAERRTASEIEAGQRLIEQIAAYLAADRATQRAMRVDWEHMIERWRRVR